MTGYQETLTDPRYHRQVVVMTAPHVGNTGVNDEDAESRRIWVAGYVVRDPALRPSNWRSRRSPGRRARRAGRRRHQRHRHPRPHPPPARARRDARRHLLRRRGRSRRRPSCSRRVRRAADEGRRPRRRGRHDEPTWSRRSASSGSPSPRSTSASRRMTPHLMAERGIEVHVLPATATIEDVQARRSGPDGVFFSNGPGDPATADARGRAAARGAGRADPVLRHLLRQPAPRPGARLRHLQAEVRPPRHQPAGAWTARTGKVEVTAHNHGFAVDAPARRRGPAPTTRRTARRRGVGRTSASTTTSSRGWNALTCLPSRSSTTRRPRPARTTPPTCSTASSR